METQKITAPGHTFNGSFDTIKQPTCSTKGLKVGKCTKCGEVVTKVELPTTEHSYGTSKTIIAPTCTSSGISYKICTECNRIETTRIPPRGHQFNGSFVIVKEPICTEDGLKEGRCTICGQTVTTSTIPKLGGSHTFNGSFEIYKKPSCLKDGEKVGKCTKCGEIVTRVVIPATGHDYGEWETGVEETCTRSGYKYRKCKNCNQYEFVTMHPTGHAFNGSFETTVNPTCTTSGEKVGKCTKCGQIITRFEIPPAHHFGDWEIITKATCGENGLKAHECTICHKRETEVIQKSSEYHSFNGSFEVIPATCTEDGARIGRCTKCGEIVTSTVIPKLGGNCSFNGSFENVKESTCTETGLKVGKCTKCGKVLQKSIIPKKEHTWSDWEEASSGIRIRTCEVCKTTEEEQIVEPAELEVHDDSFDEFHFTADGALEEVTSWDLKYAEYDDATFEQIGLTKLILKFTTNVDWTVSASSNVHVVDENGRSHLSGSAGENYIIVYLDPVSFYNTSNISEYTLTINAKETSASYTLYQSNWFFNYYDKETFINLPEIQEVINQLNGKSDAINAIQGKVNTNGQIIVYKIDDFRCLAVKTEILPERNVSLKYILYDASASAKEKTIKLSINVIKVNGLWIVDNENPIFRTSAVMSGCYVDSTDKVYEENISTLETCKFSAETLVALGCSFVPGGPVVGFLVGFAGDLIIDSVADAHIKAYVTDNGGNCVTTNTLVTLKYGCVLDSEGQDIGAYCDIENVSSPIGVINFTITDGSTENPQTVTS